MHDDQLHVATWNKTFSVTFNTDFTKHYTQILAKLPDHDLITTLFNHKAEWNKMWLLRAKISTY